VGPRAGLDAVVKRKFPSSCRDSNPRSYNLQPSAIPLSYPGSYFPLAVKYKMQKRVIVPGTELLEAGGFLPLYGDI
jgi:hypothetical protein